MRKLLCKGGVTLLVLAGQAVLKAQGNVIISLADIRFGVVY